MDAALGALADTDSDAGEDGAPAVLVPAIAVDSDPNDEPSAGTWGSGGNDAAILALRGHRYNQRGTQVLKKARATRESRKDTTHRGYVADVANRRSSRPVELVKFAGPRLKSKRGSHRRWHEVGLLSISFNSLSKPEDVSVHSTAKRAARRRKLRATKATAKSSAKRKHTGPQRGDSRVNEVMSSLAKDRKASAAHIAHTHCGFASTIVDRHVYPQSLLSKPNGHE
jgi:hypothetical protein